jgi:hypothetical protein
MYYSSKRNLTVHQSLERRSQGLERGDRARHQDVAKSLTENWRCLRILYCQEIQDRLDRKSSTQTFFHRGDTRSNRQFYWSSVAGSIVRLQFAELLRQPSPAPDSTTRSHCPNP